jgi:hypothetical protein
MGGLTTGSTRPLDSFSFIVNSSGYIVCCPLAAGYPGRYAAMLMPKLNDMKTYTILVAGIILLLSGMFTVPCVAQGICNVKAFRLENIKGKVVAQGNGNDDPVAQAKVELRSYGGTERLISSIETQDDGSFEFQHVKPGTYWVIAWKAPYFLKYAVKLKIVRKLKRSEQSSQLVIKLGAKPLEPCGGGDVKLATMNTRHNNSFNRSAS